MEQDKNKRMKENMRHAKRRWTHLFRLMWIEREMPFMGWHSCNPIIGCLRRKSFLNCCETDWMWNRSCETSSRHIEIAWVDRVCAACKLFMAFWKLSSYQKAFVNITSLFELVLMLRNIIFWFSLWCTKNTIHLNISY